LKELEEWEIEELENRTLENTRMVEFKTRKY